jgi:ApbE superfamily uncharacterized protein (UPF0280 family)
VKRDSVRWGTLISPSRERDTLVLLPQISTEVYRGLVKAGDLVTSRILVKQTDLLVSGFKDLKEEAAALVHTYRQQIEDYIERNPFFIRALSPVEPDPLAPRIINTMIEAASKANVGPMASVAGTIAEYVGLGLLPYSRDVIVENGGDVFIRSEVRREMLLLAESSEFIGLRIAIKASPKPLGVCTSSGRLGHSLSYGKADAVMVVGTSPSIADAAATGIANLIMKPSDIRKGLTRAQEMGVLGVLILVEGQMGAWGQLELVS